MEPNDNNQGNSGSSPDGTRIDLGEDLLESTRAGTAQPSAETNEPVSLEEELANGEILLNEQLYEEAKKVLRKVLRQDANNLKARKLLEQVQEKEIQELLSTENRSAKPLGSMVQSESENLSTILEALEKDLRIDLDRSDMNPVPDLFPDKGAEAAYVRNVLNSVSSLSPRDIMDIGVAHLEMGLYPAAKAIFDELIKFDEYKVSGMYLLGLSLIYGGECIEATIRLEPMVRDITLPEGQKADFLYMMALAFERLGESIKAKEFYRRVYLLNPRYRDVQEKLR